MIASLMALATGSFAAAGIAPAQSRSWLAASVPYCGSVAVAPIMLRSDAEYGFAAMIFLFAIVWGTDIIAYFVGKLVGGPRLLPQVSPKKTWSGAIAGTAAAVLAGIIVARAAGLAGSAAIALLAAVLSVFAQAGDLLEFFLKRRFGAKDLSRLIPGHGGLMDRLDAFVAASILGGGDRRCAGWARRARPAVCWCGERMDRRHSRSEFDLRRTGKPRAGSDAAGRDRLDRRQHRRSHQT